MTRLTLLAFFAISALSQPALRSVYLLPMADGLDQYLAGQIAREHVMQVVADPKLADAVMTDRLNPAFAQLLATLHPRDEDDEADGLHHSFKSTTAKGSLFLVDVKSRQVIWSSWDKPARNSSGARLNDEAGRIVKKLQSTLGR